VVSFEGETSELAKDSLPHETQYNHAFHWVLQTMGYQSFAPQSSKEGEGKPDLRVHIGEESFASSIIGNDSEKMLETLKKTEAGKVQLIGLVPNIAHTAHTVHVKSKGIERINTCNVDCDLVARKLVLKDNGKPELHSVQSLKSINLPPKAETSQPAKTEMVWVRELKEENGEYKLVGNALPIEPMPVNIGFLKKVIKEEKPSRVQCDADETRIFHLTEGTWQEEKMSATLRPSTEETPYGYLVP
ncbi:unnamed protein product, partial [Effrenium voratum]